MESIEGEAGNFRVRIRRKPRYVDIDKCTGCGDCTRTYIGNDHPPREKDGELWVDRVHVDEAACVQCGECAVACMQSNPNWQPAMKNVALERILQVVHATGPIEYPTMVQKILLMNPSERKAFWNEQFKKCIRCYGCMDVCPVYMGPVEGLEFDRWIKRAEVPPTYPAFHLLRAYHVFETCVLCGECEMTCPVSIPLKALQDITQYFPPEDVFEFIPGLDENVKQAIMEYLRQVGDERTERIKHAI